MSGVLIVDNNPVIRQLLRKTVELETPFEVAGEAANGEEAIERAIELVPDLVLLDLVMPVLNGLDAAPKIRAALPTTNIILFTFRGDQVSRLSANCGIDLVLSKSEGLARLHQYITEMLNRAAEPGRPEPLRNAGSIATPSSGHPDDVVTHR